MKRCKQHPKYKGMRPPRKKCDDCCILYLENAKEDTAQQLIHMRRVMNLMRTGRSSGR